MQRATIIVMATDENQRGDLFGRLACDAFHSLGYEEFLLNTNRSGREIDIKGRHRTEQKLLVAECKATGRPIGGADLNKFAGASQVESRLTTSSLSAYFVSLSGFTSSAIEQEREAGPRMHLMDAAGLISELVRGKVIVSREEAIAAAAIAVRRVPRGASMHGEPVLIAHEIGWHWCLQFKIAGELTHYTLIHADGYGISDSLAYDIREADSNSTNMLSKLQYVSSVETPGPTEEEREVRAQYIDFLLREFGSVTLEGLPVDQETGFRSLRLDALYVPQKFEPTAASNEEGEDTPPTMSTLGILQENRHVAVLAGPGSGKTTLLKRLAVAYADAASRIRFADRLPDEDLFPLFIRCRQLADKCRQPIVKILGSLIEQAEVLDKGEAFSNIIGAHLKTGTTLILVDGLDEINDPGDRLAFTTQLRTFMATYPKVRVIVTSREAGFRSVAGAVALVCSTYQIADLSDGDIRQLCDSWHREMLGDTSASQAAADDAYLAIVNNPRVAALAVNPLLLNTLLLVKRWLGEIPSKRTVLYSKAIEVLLMTWNTEGHESIDMEEGLPQLAYAAFAMLKSEKQSVSARELRSLLVGARNDMPEILGYSKVPVDEFIRRVEERSSLIVQSGIIVENGISRPLYEFKHLTFQEYLAALAVAESWHPGRDEEADPSVVLAPYLANQAWLEVIPLATVLSGIKHAKLIVQTLIEEIKQYEVEDFEGYYDEVSRKFVGHPLYLNLLGCMVDGSPVHPDLAREALQTLISHWAGQVDLSHHFRGNRLRPLLSDLVWDEYQGDSSQYVRCAQIIAQLATEDVPLDPIELTTRLASSDDRTAVVAACALTRYFEILGIYRRRRQSERSYRDNTAPLPLKSALLELIVRDAQPARRYAGVWSLTWASPFYFWSKAEVKAIIEAVTDLWRDEWDDEVCNIYWAAICCLPVEGIRFTSDELELPDDLRQCIESFLAEDLSGDSSDAKLAAVKLAYFHEDSFTDETVIAEIGELESMGMHAPDEFESLRKAINQPVLFVI